jgi:hypothetical protein
MAAIVDDISEKLSKCWYLQDTTPVSLNSSQYSHTGHQRSYIEGEVQYSSAEALAVYLFTAPFITLKSP